MQHERQRSGFWTEDEPLLDLNLLEMEAVYRGLRAGQECLSDFTIAVLSVTHDSSFLPEQAGGDEFQDLVSEQDTSTPLGRSP